MPRKSREYSNSKVYHIIQKGIDNQEIFYEDIDRITFMKMLLENKKEYEYKIFAYALMNNHIHLVIKIEDESLSRAIKNLSIKYVAYFNKKYLRSGPLFHNRFKSKSIENKIYFLDVCRYIEQNPEKAGISRVEDFKWSSYHEYIGKNKLVDRDTLLHYFDNDINQYIFFTTKGRSQNKSDFIEFELRNKMNDDELSNLIIEEFKLNNIKEFLELPKEEFRKGIEFLKKLQYTSLNQISRVTRINTYQLSKYWKRGG